MFLETSKDFLYVILAFCILWFTVFLCWLLYQAARVLRNANKIVENVTEKLELINEAVQYMRSRVDSATKHMGIVSGMLSEVSLPPCERKSCVSTSVCCARSGDKKMRRLVASIAVGSTGLAAWSYPHLYHARQTG